jgi:hypothetical protein
MNSRSSFLVGLGLFFLSLGANASTVSLDVSSDYNFPLAGGGGGAIATLNGKSVETYCDDFYNSIDLSTDYTAYVTVLGTDANLSDTRFGNLPSTGWVAISLSSGDTTVDNWDDTFFNSGAGTSALARYEMVAYLVSQYNLSAGASVNNPIQEAIWTLMDPKAEGPAEDPSGANPTAYLEQAASWYVMMNTSSNVGALNSFLSQYEVLDQAGMSFDNGLGCGGFQEQIVAVPTPEPRLVSAMLLALFAAGAVLLRRTRLVHSNIHSASF